MLTHPTAVGTFELLQKLALRLEVVMTASVPV